MPSLVSHLDPKLGSATTSVVKLHLQGTQEQSCKFFTSSRQSMCDFVSSPYNEKRARVFKAGYQTNKLTKKSAVAVLAASPFVLPSKAAHSLGALPHFLASTEEALANNELPVSSLSPEDLSTTRGH